MNRAWLTSLASLILLACGGSGATAPQEPTAAEHERAAERAERDAQAYETAEAQAAGPHASQQDYPSAPHNRRAAIEHREQAAERRALAQGLRAAEEQACAGLPEDQPDPLLRREDVTFVSIIEQRSMSVIGAADTLRTVGVRVRLRAAPGTTTESLQHVLDCHVARARAAGTAGALGDGSPLALEDVKAKVGWMEDGFAINLTSDDPDTVQEILGWAQARGAE